MIIYGANTTFSTTSTSTTSTSNYVPFTFRVVVALPPEPVEHRLLRAIGLLPGAEPKEIKRRYRQLARELHPDVGGDHARFVALQQVYEDLKKRGLAA